MKTQIPLTRRSVRQGIRFAFLGEFEVLGPTIEIALEITMPDGKTRRYSPRIYPLLDSSDGAVRTAIDDAAWDLVMRYRSLTSADPAVPS